MAVATRACARTRAQHSSCAGVSWAGGRTDPAERSRRSRTCGARGASVRTRTFAPEAAFSRICDAALAGAAGLGGVRQGARRAHVGGGRESGGRVRRALRVSEGRGVRGRARGCGLCARGSRCVRPVRGGALATRPSIGAGTDDLAGGRPRDMASGWLLSTGGNHRTVQEFRILQAVKKSSL